MPSDVPFKLAYSEPVNGISSIDGSPRNDSMEGCRVFGTVVFAWQRTTFFPDQRAHGYFGEDALTSIR